MGVWFSRYPCIDTRDYLYDYGGNFGSTQSIEILPDDLVIRSVDAKEVKVGDKHLYANKDVCGHVTMVENVEIRKVKVVTVRKDPVGFENIDIVYEDKTTGFKLNYDEVVSISPRKTFMNIIFPKDKSCLIYVHEGREISIYRRVKDLKHKDIVDVQNSRKYPSISVVINIFDEHVSKICLKVSRITECDSGIRCETLGGTVDPSSLVRIYPSISMVGMYNDLIERMGKKN